jgi:hypothetical protein
VLIKLNKVISAWNAGTFFAKSGRELRDKAGSERCGNSLKNVPKILHTLFPHVQKCQIFSGKELTF